MKFRLLADCSAGSGSNVFGDGKTDFHKLNRTQVVTPTHGE